jgi:hypothetical protein
MRKRSEFKFSTFISAVIVACAVFAVLGIAYYIIFPARGLFNSDSSDTILWAQASYNAKALLNSHFQYAGFLPFSGYLLMLPFIGAFGVSMTTHTIGMVLFLVLFVASILFFARSLKWNMRWSASAVAILLLVFSSSDKLREIFWRHNIYYSLSILFIMIGTGLVLRFLNDADIPAEKRGVRYKVYAALLFAWFFVCSTNGFQSLVLFSIPLIAAVAGEIFLSFKTKLTDKGHIETYKSIFIMTAGMIFGYIAGLLLIGGMKSEYAQIFSSYTSSNYWVGNLNSFLAHWTSLLGVDVTYGDPISSPAGMYNLLKIAMSFILVLVPVVMAILYGKFKDRATRILIVTHWVMTLLVLFGYIFGRLSDANWRLSPIVCTATVLCIVFSKWLYENIGFRRLSVLILVPIILISGLNAAKLAFMPPDLRQNDEIHKVMNYLIDNDFTYGYATFWRSNGITVMSDSRVKIRHISITGAEYSPNYYQSQYDWYDDQPGQDRYFVLLIREEYDAMVHDQNTLIATADEKLEFDDYMILVYDRNIF